MKKKLPLIIIAALVLLILLGAIVLYFSTRKSKIYVPIFESSPPQSLSKAIQKSALHLDSTPFITKDSLTASVSGYSVLFSLHKDLTVQVRALQLVVPRLKMDNKSIREIDLRFDKVIIRY